MKKSHPSSTSRKYALGFINYKYPNPYKCNKSQENARRLEQMNKGIK